MPTAVVAAVLDELQAWAPKAFDEAADRIGVPLALLARGYASLSGHADEQDLLRLTWLVATVGPATKQPPTLFEIRLRKRADCDLVCPGWLLSVPCSSPTVSSRLPALPLIDGLLDEETRVAYDGLVEHVEHRASFLARDEPEVSLSSILWRAGALIDYLEPKLGDRDGMAQRALRLRQRCIANNAASSGEVELWGLLGADFAGRRNILTHLESSGGHATTIRDAVAWCLAHRDDVLRIAACVSHGVLSVAASVQRERSPPGGDVRWIVDLA